jgi:LAGLIDADG DNA endonuclease family protein
LKLPPISLGDDNQILEHLARISPQWLAGFFDGDGYVGIMRFRSSASARKWYLRLKCNFTNKDVFTLAVIAKKFGCSQPILKQAKKYKSDVYELDICGERAVSFLETIKDYVIIRREQVELALEFASIMHVGSGNKLSDEQISKGIELRNKISELNGAGRKLLDLEVSDFVDRRL